MRRIGRTFRFYLLFFLVLLAGCQTGDLNPSIDSVLSDGVFGDTSAKQKNTKDRDTVFSTGRINRYGERSQNFGPDLVGLSPIDTESVSTAGQYSLNFENTDVKEVVRAVLNDALKVNYTIAGDVSGNVTISSARPVSRKDLLLSLENALSTYGFSMFKTASGYRIAASGANGGAVDVGRRAEPGFGVSIIPLRFVQAATMTELLAGFIAQAEGLKIDTARNSIIVRGSGQQRNEVIEAINSFDSDFMQSQRVSIFRLGQAKPADVVPELERIFNVKGSNGLIQFQPVNRVRGVMAISKNAALIRRAESWIRRLDQQDSDTGDNVVVYKARYRKAEELARVMNNLFSSGAQSTTPTQQAKTPTLMPTETPGETASTEGDPITNRIASAFDDAANSNTLDTGPNVVDLTSAANASPSIRISADPANNSVVIYGDAEQARQIVATLRKLDSTPVQVAIGVTIAEVRLNSDLQYGVQYFLKSKQFGLGKDNGSLSLLKDAGNAIKKQTPGLNFVAGANADPDIIISALNTLTDVEILSSPSLVVLENQTATLQVGDQVPITTQQSQSTQSGLAPVINQVEFKDTGIILNVTPRISQSDTVTMDIIQEISNVASGANTLTPTISRRSIKTLISVNDQQTVVLGGLISANSQTSKSGVPGLMKLPLVGGMFSSNAKTKGRTELIVLIRPTIIRDAQDASDVAESLRSQMSVISNRGAVSK